MTTGSPLEGLVAVVTGANSGIGLGIASALGGAGARVAVWGRRGARNAAACERLRAGGVVAEPIVCDVMDEMQVDVAMANTLELFGRVDVMVANAGIGTAARFVDLSLADWDRVLGTDLTGAFLCFRAAARELRRVNSPGSLVAVSSLAALQAQPDMAHYAAAKAGLHGLVRSVAAELAPFGIRCNALTPGFTDTEGLSFDNASEQLKLETLSAIPVGRWASQADLGAAACFLADPRLIMHTGDSLVVDGGNVTLPGYLAVRNALRHSTRTSPE